MFKLRDGLTEDPILVHQPCPNCGSSDARSIWADGGSYCHSCGHKTSSNDKDKVLVRKKEPTVSIELKPPKDGEYPNKDIRGLNTETFKKFGVKFTYDNRAIFPYRNQSNELANQKVWSKDKSIYNNAIKDASAGGFQLFGQHLWGNKGGKYLIVTEGEWDAMAVSQVNLHKWPVVSVGSGAKGALDHLLLNLSFLEKYENIVLMFDNDEQGKKAAQEVAMGLAGSITVKVAELPLKDANDMVRAGRGKELIDLMFNAPEWRPQGVVNAKDLIEEYSELKAPNAVPYPYDGLTAITLGLREGEIVTIGAGSGVGKTQFCTEMAYDLITSRRKRVGLVFREQGWGRTLDGLAGLATGRKFHIERSLEGLPDEIQRIVRERKHIGEFDRDSARKALDGLLSDGLLYIDKFWGSEPFDALLSKIRYLAISKKCDVIILDHISIVVSGLEINDERKAIDVAYTKLREMCETYRVALVIVSHLRRPDGNKGFEEGLEITLSHFRGSQAIGQLSDIVLGLQRNKKDPERKFYTEIVVIKNRFTGDDGCTACWLKWDDDTGRLHEADPPWLNEEQENNNELFEDLEF